jgi:hypothetical protein
MITAIVAIYEGNDHGSGGEISSSVHISDIDNNDCCQGHDDGYQFGGCEHGGCTVELCEYPSPIGVYKLNSLYRLHSNGVFPGV